MATKNLRIHKVLGDQKRHIVYELRNLRKIVDSYQNDKDIARGNCICKIIIHDENME